MVYNKLDIKENPMSVTFETIVNHAKTSGFVYPGSEIYGGLANTWGFWTFGHRAQGQHQKSLVAKVHPSQ